MRITVLIAGFEQICVNPVFDFGAVQATQAELVAAARMVCGLAGIAVSIRRKKRAPAESTMAATA